MREAIQRMADEAFFRQDWRGGPMVMQATQQKKHQKRRTVLYGVPKGPGKTTLAMYAEKPILHEAFDKFDPEGGFAVIPPGANGDHIYVQAYPEMPQETHLEKLVPTQELAKRIDQDLNLIIKAAATKADIKFTDGSVAPFPKTLVIDGAVRMNWALCDSLCVLNNVQHPSAMGKQTQKFYGVRLDYLVKTFKSILSLPCNVIIITWSNFETDNEGRRTAVQYPDFGGKMDIWGPGMANACLYCFMENGVHKVLTQANAFHPQVGVEGIYGLKPIIETEIGPKYGPLNPWERIFGQEVK